MPPLRGPADSLATLRGFWQLSDEAPIRLGPVSPGGITAVRLDCRGWTAAQHLAPCVTRRSRVASPVRSQGIDQALTRVRTTRPSATLDTIGTSASCPARLVSCPQDGGT